MFLQQLDRYLETLSEYVYDNDKIVTYKWLSKELEVHVNVAKQILWEFWQKHKAEGNIECTVLLMGFLEDNCMRVEVVKEANLSTAKNKFRNIISEHLYSVQKCLPDIELLAISGSGDVKFSAIKCNECVQRSDEELSTLRWRIGFDNRVAHTAKKELKHANPPQEVSKPIDTDGQSNNNKKANGIQKSTSTQKSGFNNLFGKVVTKQKSPETSTDKTKSQNEELIKETSANKKGSKTLNKRISPNQKNRKGKLDNFIVKSKDEPMEATPSGNVEPPKTVFTEQKKEEEKPKKSNNRKEDNMSANARGRKRNRSKESESTVKKRKRIIVDDESSNSDSDRDIAEVPSSPEPCPSPTTFSKKEDSPPRVKYEGGKRRVLKVVDKMVEEDGFFVTKKVHEYVECAEDEPESVQQPVSEPEPPKLEKSRKQTRLTKFFTNCNKY